jgi:predicted dehydrogenase
MTDEAQFGRRGFLKGVAAAPAVLAQRNPNDRLGVACIGVGTRGHGLLPEAQAIPNVEIRIICDLYTGHVARAEKLCTNPKVRVVHEWEKAVADPDIDVVIIATPDFWHAPMVLAAAAAKKDIYTEKGWCMSMADAKKMRRAIRESRVVMQLGHQYRSVPSMHRAREIYRSGELGRVNMIRILEDRTFPSPYWKFYNDYDILEMPKDASPQTIDWDRWIANAPRQPFSIDRFFTWRCWWDYGTGIAGDLMSHLWDGANFIVEMGIPESVSTQGGMYFWKEARDVPDTWNVLFDYPSRDLAVTFSCTQMSKHYGEVTQLLGREKTMECSAGGCRTYPAEWKPEVQKRLADLRKEAVAKGLSPAGMTIQPDYVFKPGDLKVTSHMENFIECVRTRGVPRCGVDRAFEEAAAIMMSVESFKQGRRVRWDKAQEEIV